MRTHKSRTTSRVPCTFAYPFVAYLVRAVFLFAFVAGVSKSAPDPDSQPFIHAVRHFVPIRQTIIISERNVGRMTAGMRKAYVCVCVCVSWDKTIVFWCAFSYLHTFVNRTAEIKT